MNPALDLLRTAIQTLADGVDERGEVIDPVVHRPTQYGTAYMAWCQAVLAEHSDADADVHRALARRCGDAALRHVEDPTLTPNISGVDPATGTLTAINHRDFFWPPLLKTFRWLNESAWRSRLADLDIERAFASRPPSNWSAVWLSGEWLRMTLGLSPIGRDRFDDWLATFFEHHILLERGFYQEPGHPNSYDLFTRLHLLDLLVEGYDGRWRDPLLTLARLGLRRSLAVQLSDGSLASAHRSTGQTWTLGAQIALFTLSGKALALSADDARAARGAAQRALRAMTLAVRPDGSFSPVQNALPPSSRIGYESYTADAHYSTLALAFLATAIHHGMDSAEGDALDAAAPRVWIDADPLDRAVVHGRGVSLHVNARPAAGYDGFGIVDLTFGPGRRLQWTSSVRHADRPGFLNLGLAWRRGGAGGPIEPIAATAMTLIDPIQPCDGGVGLRLRARPAGSPTCYELQAMIDGGDVRIIESTPGDRRPKSLLAPYVHDTGHGPTTRVVIEPLDGRTLVRFILGDEMIVLQLAAAVESWINLTGGFTNRRGLCGLLRLDLAGAPESVTYTLRADR